MNITINGTTYRIVTTDDLVLFLHAIQSLQALARGKAA
jgi:hypothetical protein